MGLFKSIKKAVKKVAKVALPIAATAGLGYLGGSALGLFGSSSSSAAGKAAAGAAAGAAGKAVAGVAANAATNSAKSVSNSASSLDWAKLGLAGVNSAASLYQASRSEDIAQENLQQQMDWNEYAAKHAHQWEMEDLRNAGLNPILTATGGNGASVHAVTPQMPDLSGYGNAVSNAFNILSSINNLKTQEANIGLINSDILKNLQETSNLIITGKHTAKDIEILDETLKKLKWETSHFGEDNPVGRAAEDIKRYYGNTLAGQFLLWLLGVQQDTYPNIHPKLSKSGGN